MQWGRRGAYRVFVGKPEGERPYGKPRRKWMNNIDLRENRLGVWTRLISLRIRTSARLL